MILGFANIKINLTLCKFCYLCGIIFIRFINLIQIIRIAIFTFLITLVSFTSVFKLELTVMEEEKIPLWKKLAMEKGLIPEETDSSSGTGKEVGKEEKDGQARTVKKPRPAQRRYCTMRVYADSLPALRRYATFSGNENARSYAEILDALLGDLEKTYQVINEMLAQKKANYIR